MQKPQKMPKTGEQPKLQKKSLNMHAQPIHHLIQKKIKNNRT